jgi:very-short-patch-repair endonuclease
MRKQMTDAECRLWFDCLQKLPYRFRKQRPIGRFIVDFYCPELNLVVEVDGESHNSREAITYDQARTDFLQAQRLTVLRYTNAEVLCDLGAVHQGIINWIANVNLVPPSGGMSRSDRGEGARMSSPQPFGQLPEGEH